MTVHIHKCDLAGRWQYNYTGEVVRREGDTVVIRALWTRGMMALPYVTLEDGDVFEEVFYLDRWYNIFEIRTPQGRLKGWYANVTRPARFDGLHLDWDDLKLDVWMNERGESVVLDEDEFAALEHELSLVERASARGALDQLMAELHGRWRAHANQQIAERLQARSWTLATAESCTGGLLGDVITDRAGSSTYFVGGVIAYSNAVKQRLLGVRSETLEREGAVSATCALEMARGVRDALRADVGVGTTGIAGPGGGTPSKPVGTVYVSVSTPEGEWVMQHCWRGDRLVNKRATVDAALRLLLDVLPEPDAREAAC
ncbi:MAG: nicotinamide-nucleotide amidohydrolase family protein [Thermoflexales bacterium]